jgi:hypothetical protein
MTDSGFSVVTGGQTGVDRAALDAALACGIPCGGWCPAGRSAEDGPIPARYPLTETPEADPAFRTRRNVAEADGTLIIVHGAPDQGSRLAQGAARELGRAHLTLDLSRTAPDAACALVAAWIAREGIRTLNIAGPRESNAPGIYCRARPFLTSLFAGLCPE